MGQGESVALINIQSVAEAPRMGILDENHYRETRTDARYLQNIRRSPVRDTEVSELESEKLVLYETITINVFEREKTMFRS